MDDVIGSDSEGEDVKKDGGSAAPIQLPAADPVDGYDEAKLPSNVKEAHAIASMEEVKKLKDEIVKLQETEPAKPVPEVDPADPKSPFSVRATESLHDEIDCRTVWDILGHGDFQRFKPPKKDNERLCLARIRSICPMIRSLVRRVRLYEQVLSRAVIEGKPNRNVGRYQLLVHHLARLRRKYALNTTRQSRFVAWSFFSRTVADRAIKKVKSIPPHPDETQPATEIKAFTPSCHVLDGQRCYQILAVRTHLLAKPKLVLVEEVIRGSIDRRGRRNGRKLTEQTLDAHMVAAVRGVILQPLGRKSEGEDWLFSCSCRSPSGVFETCDEDGCLLWQVDPKFYTVEEGSVELILKVKDLAVQCLLKMDGDGTVPSFKAGAEEQKQTTKVSFTVEAFRNRRNVMLYVDVMNRMLAKSLGHGRKLKVGSLVFSGNQMIETHRVSLSIIE